MTKSPSISQLIKTAANKDQSFFLNENIIKVMCLKSLNVTQCPYGNGSGNVFMTR